MLTLYGVYRSRASRPLWLLAEIGLAFRHVPVVQAYRLADPGAEDAPLNTASPQFLAVSPQAAIPVMEDQGLVLTESLAICSYIARRYGGDLGPQNPTEQALCEQWALFAATAIDPPGLEILYTYDAGHQDTPQGAAKIAAAVASLARPMARLENILARQETLIEGRFTVADLMLAECLRYLAPHSPVMAAHPAVTAWLARCQARPAFQAMMTARSAERA
tara:strand:- start:45 stop:704 length:660 start_codon:yes stop_codon:yes gene_type:complete